MGPEREAFTSTGVEVVRGLCVFMQNASRSHVIGVGQVARCMRRGGLFP
ncbi:glutamate dehydrogenase (NAD(P)+) [Rhodococcus opacus RKJ300 = JCM 13270]|uniref:Glutamate dehydrogenase (NAD(P)+) n=1 Tax=Rhodococcus opacus RKJ300 = JCM 13270 TaxID=1165867 RepID=I0WN48_RHOOP|nr:glutamate dehydrogenase (NAD(P)+) [Rhodococcus opacus RKJ300 = JCM 13270]